MALPLGTDAVSVGQGSSGGDVLGPATTSKIGFYGTTPVARLTGATQATLTATWVTISSGFGFSSSDQIISVITAIQQLQNLATTLGLWKGSA